MTTKILLVIDEDEGTPMRSVKDALEKAGLGVGVTNNNQIMRAAIAALAERKASDVVAMVTRAAVAKGPKAKS